MIWIRGSPRSGRSIKILPSLINMEQMVRMQMFDQVPAWFTINTETSKKGLLIF
jgi:hypothetical protein